MVSLQELTRQLSLLHEAQWSASSKGQAQWSDPARESRRQPGESGLPCSWGMPPVCGQQPFEQTSGSLAGPGCSPCLARAGRRPGIPRRAFTVDSGECGRPGRGRGSPPQVLKLQVLRTSLVCVSWERAVRPPHRPACRPADAVFCPQWTRRTLERLFHPRLWQKEGWCVAVSDL